MGTRLALRGGSSVLLVAFVVMLVLALGAGAALAQDGDDGRDDNEQIVLHGTLDVPADMTVGTAVILDGPATVEGTVEDALVVLNGDADISGEVRRDVVVLNGDVVIRSGATVGGDVVSSRSPTIEDGATVEGDVTNVAVRFDWAEFGLASRYFWWVAFSVSTLILGMILLFVVPRLDIDLMRASRDRMGAAIGIGVGWFLLIPVAAGLLLVTVVGFPLGFFTLLALAFIYTVGYTVGAVAVGRMFVKPPTSRYLAFLAGWGALRVLALIPVVAGILFVAAAVLGFGLLVVASRRRDLPEGADVPMAAPPPAPPVPV